MGLRPKPPSDGAGANPLRSFGTGESHRCCAAVDRRSARGLWGAAVVALALAGCFPVATPPLKGDLGYASRLGGDSGYRFSGGFSVASISIDKDFPIDLGGGYVQTDTHDGVPRSRLNGLANPNLVNDDSDRPVHGVYLESRKRLNGGSFWRLFAGPRFEYYFDPRGPEPGFAGVGRLEIELFGTTEFEPIEGENDNGSAYWGLTYGVVAIGAYLEAGYQHLPNDAAYPLLGGGILVRIPATIGLVCCAWDLAKSSSSK